MMTIKLNSELVRILMGSTGDELVSLELLVIYSVFLDFYD